MRLLRFLRSILRIPANRRRFEDEMSDELRFHLEIYTEDLVQQGLPRADAGRRARAELGSAEGLKEALREARGLRFADELVQDVRYAVRRFPRSRSIATLLVLAVGIGVNLAVFSVIHAALLRPLPHPEPDRLVVISSRSLQSGREHLTAPLDFFDIERRARSFSRLAAYYPPGFTLTGNGEAERVGGARASSGIFDVFGVQPALGRMFVPSEDGPGAPPVAIISHSLWVRRYGGDPAAVGRSIVLSGRVHTIVGVLPDGFHAPAMWPRMPDVWVPIGFDPNVSRRDARMLRVLGRLRPGVTLEQARAELDAIAASIAADHPDSNAQVGATAAGMAGSLTRTVRPSLAALGAAVLALLLVACGNAAGLLVGGTLARRHELATRIALGAGRGRIVRQLLAESLVIGLMAGGLGFVLAVFASDFVTAAAAAAGVPRAADIRVGGTAFAVGLLLSVVCTVACALISALTTTAARDLQIARGPGFHGARRHRSRAVLIGLEAAFSLALLVGAALLLRSVHALQSTDPGFAASGVLTARLSAPQARYPAGPVLAAFFDRVLERVGALPGVESAALVDWLPASGFGASVPFRQADRDSSQLAELRVVSDQYFATLGIPLVAGRRFDARDTTTAPHAIVVNAALARTFFDGGAAIGQRLVLDVGTKLDLEIVGVVGDVRDLALPVAPGPAIYAPRTQAPWNRRETRDLVIRASVEPLSLAPAIQAALRDIEPEIPRPQIVPMDDVLAQAVVRPRFYAWAVTGFALIAALLAAFGTYSVVASAVAERRREIGVRLALGASSAHVLARAARDGAVPTLLGLTAGIPLAFVAGRLVRQQLYGIQPTDAATLGAVLVFMSGVAIVAAVIPAARAARIDPVLTLRHESGE